MPCSYSEVGYMGFEPPACLQSINKPEYIRPRKTSSDRFQLYENSKQSIVQSVLCVCNVSTLFFFCFCVHLPVSGSCIFVATDAILNSLQMGLNVNVLDFFGVPDFLRNVSAAASVYLVYKIKPSTKRKAYLVFSEIYRRI